jgi:hypothetical protein
MGIAGGCAADDRGIAATATVAAAPVMNDLRVTRTVSAYVNHRAGTIVLLVLKFHSGFLCYPRPMNGIFVAITVMNWTFASSGRLAM